MQRCLFETSVTLKFSATAFEGKETRKRLLIYVLGWRPAQSSGFFVYFQSLRFGPWLATGSCHCEAGIPPNRVLAHPNPRDLW